MTTPGHLAGLSTRPRRDAQRSNERWRLLETLAAATELRDSTRKALNHLRGKYENACRQAAERDALRPLYPPTVAMASSPTHLDGLRRELPHATALGAAAQVAFESAQLELAWFERDATVPDTGAGWHAAELVRKLTDDLVTAPGYTVTMLRPDWRARGGPWLSDEPQTVKRSRARSLLGAWMSAPHAWALNDVDGRLYITTPSMRLELVPTDIAPPPTEGDVLRAALDAYGFPAYDDEERGFTWLAVPLDPATPEHETYQRPHFRISSGEHADRPASAHDEPWGVSLYDEDGDHVTMLGGAPDGATLAEECAHVARTIAEFTPLVQDGPA
jgi:hypothetical protein